MDVEQVRRNALWNGASSEEAEAEVSAFVTRRNDERMRERMCYCDVGNQRAHYPSRLCY